MFTPAKRQMSKLRLGLIGPSGSGKTFSALKIAEGLGGRIALLDTDRGSGNLYGAECKKTSLHSTGINDKWLVAQYRTFFYL